MTHTTALTSKERVRLSLDWQEPDRVPIQIYTTPELSERLAAYFGGRNVLECLGVDFRGVNPAYRGPIREPRDGLTFDLWGTGYRRVEHGEAGAYQEAALLPLADLETMDDVARYPWPSPDDFDYSHVPEQCERVKDFAVCARGAGSPDIVNGV